jgi:hypothetical protein
MFALKLALNARVTAAPKTSNQMCFQIPFKMILTLHLRTVVILLYYEYFTRTYVILGQNVWLPTDRSIRENGQKRR